MLEIFGPPWRRAGLGRSATVAAHNYSALDFARPRLLTSGGASERFAIARTVTATGDPCPPRLVFTYSQLKSGLGQW